jgi:two-component system sensor histidine kinase/response regulator
MTSHQIHALLIEDDPDDILLLKDTLAEVGLGKIKLDYSDRLSRGLIQLSGQTYDVILLDLNLPDSRGLDTLMTTIKRFPKIPVVVLSGLADDVTTTEAVRQGAQDYLVKGEINGPLVMRVIRYAIERKQVEAVLRASEARYRTLVEASPSGITLADLEGKLLLCNQQATRLYGYANPDAMIGINVFKLIAPADRRLAVLNTQRTLNENRVTNAQYTLLRRDDSQFPGEISTAVLRDNAGVPTGFISITHDITERKKAIESEKQLVMLEKEFISGVSHELRTPLVSLMDYLKLLRNVKARGTGALNDVLAHASLDAGRLLDLVDELLDFSLLEGDRLILNWKKVDFSKVIDNVLESLREQANAKRVTLLFAPTDTPLVADMDPLRMRRVLINLVNNSINSSEPGDKVLITGKSINGEIIINVIDEGMGISSEECARIFEKYFQVRPQLDQDTSGMGLGLYTSKQIVDAHGGTLRVSSQEGAGSTYTLTIPINKKLKPVSETS